MVFQFPEVTECQITNVNVRREFHGDERVPAFDLTFSKEGSNELLDLIDPALRPTLYYNAAATQGQAALPDVLAILPNLRVPKLCNGKFSYARKEKWKGYRFVLDYGLGDELSNIDIGDCTVQIGDIDCKEGGTCVIKWLVSFEADRLSDEVRGRITGLTDEAVFIQLIAASTLQLVKGKNGKAKDEGDPDGDDDDDKPDAGDIFAAQHGEGAGPGDADDDSSAE
jgi:hypothetical protein